jgi:hypothetical protein
MEVFARKPGSDPSFHSEIIRKSQKIRKLKFVIFDINSFRNSTMYMKYKIDHVSLRYLSWIVYILLISITIEACSGANNTNSKNGEKILPVRKAASLMEPYLGKWRPTSFQEELNEGNITITKDRYSTQSGTTIEFVPETSRNPYLIVRVSKIKPVESSFKARYLILSLEEELRRNYKNKYKKDREFLKICYTGVKKELLSAEVLNQCGNIYFRIAK